MSNALQTQAQHQPAPPALIEGNTPLDFSDRQIPPELWSRVRAPIRTGLAVIGVFVFGAFAYAMVAPLAGAVMAPGLVRVEDNAKIIRHRDGGIVREILVNEGDQVQAGQVLMVFDDVPARANVDVTRSAYFGALAQRARFEAEREGAEQITLPQELGSQTENAAVLRLYNDQRALFETRRASLEGQLDILAKRVEQSQTRLDGLRAQLTATERQIELIEDELKGVQQLFDKSLVPRTRLLSLQRAAAELNGNRGNLIAEIARTEQGVGEAQLTISQLRQQRSAEVAEGLRDAQARIFDALPRMRAAEETLVQTRVRAPVAGYVHQLTQFTRDGVVQPGERLLNIVPSDAPLVLEARLKPDEALEVATGMRANVQLATFEARQLPPIPATVQRVSADRLQDPRTGEPYFNAEVAIDPAALKELGTRVRIYPGMSATVMIATSHRTVMDYILSPIKDSMRGALRER